MALAFPFHTIGIFPRKGGNTQGDIMLRTIAHACILSFILTACGSGGSDSNTSDSNSPNESVSTDAFEVTGILEDTDIQTSDGSYADFIPLGEVKKGWIIEAYMEMDISNPDDLSLIDPYLSVARQEGPSGFMTLQSDDDSGNINSAYLQFAAPADNNYYLVASTYNADETGKWRLLYLIRAPDSGDHVLFDPATADADDSDDSDSGSSGTCMKTCQQCYRLERSSCSCHMRVDYSYCMDNDLGHND